MVFRATPPHSHHLIFLEHLLTSCAPPSILSFFRHTLCHHHLPFTGHSPPPSSYHIFKALLAPHPFLSFPLCSPQHPLLAFLEHYSPSSSFSGHPLPWSSSPFFRAHLDLSDFLGCSSCHLLTFSRCSPAMVLFLLFFRVPLDLPLHSPLPSSSYLLMSFLPAVLFWGTPPTILFSVLGCSLPPSFSPFLGVPLDPAVHSPHHALLVFPGCSPCCPLLTFLVCSPLPSSSHFFEVLPPVVLFLLLSGCLLICSCTPSAILFLLVHVIPPCCPFLFQSISPHCPVLTIFGVRLDPLVHFPTSTSSCFFWVLPSTILFLYFHGAPPSTLFSHFQGASPPPASSYFFRVPLDPPGLSSLPSYSFGSTSWTITLLSYLFSGAY